MSLIGDSEYTVRLLKRPGGVFLSREREDCMWADGILGSHVVYRRESRIYFLVNVFYWVGGSDGEMIAHVIHWRRDISTRDVERQGVYRVYCGTAGISASRRCHTLAGPVVRRQWSCINRTM